MSSLTDREAVDPDNTTRTGTVLSDLCGYTALAWMSFFSSAVYILDVNKSNVVVALVHSNLPSIACHLTYKHLIWLYNH